MRHRRTLALFIFGGALVVYLVTMTAGVAGYDGGEFQFVPYVLGLPHPTGYPLYTLFGKLWITLVPIGPVALRMNLLSAVAASAAAALTFFFVLQLTGRVGAGAVAALVLAFDKWFWENALIASVRPVHILLVVLTFLLTIEWSDQVRRGADSWRKLCWLAVCIGVGLAHHRTYLFILPGVALFVAAQQPGLFLNPKRLMQPALLMAMPVTTYLYLLVRGIWSDAWTQLPVTDLQTWWELITGSTVTGARMVFETGPMLLQATRIYEGLAKEFPLPLLLLAAIGMAVLPSLSWKAFALVGGAFAVTFLMLTLLTPATVMYESFSMNLNLLVAVCVGLGVSTFAGLVSAVAKGQLAVPLGFATTVVAVLAVVWWGTFPAALYVRAANAAPMSPSRVKLSGTQPERLVADSLPRLVPNAMVLGDWMQITPFWYFQYVDGERPDVRLFYSVNDWRAIGEEEHKFGRPLYLTRKVPEMFGQKHLGMTGPLIHWAGEAQTEIASDVKPHEVCFGDDFTLLGYRHRLIAATGWFAARPYVAQLSLWWQAKRVPTKDYSISVRLVNAEGRQVAQSDSLHPVLGLYPTSQWDAGEIVEDYYELRADPSDQSQEYHIEIRVYWKARGGAIHNLQTDEGDRVVLAPLAVNP